MLSYTYLKTDRLPPISFHITIAPVYLRDKTVLTSKGGCNHQLLIFKWLKRVLWEQTKSTLDAGVRLLVPLSAQ